MSDLITCALDQGLLTLTFNRLDKLNALNNAMYSELDRHLQAASEDPAVEVILLTGGATCFSAGNDLRDFLDNPPRDLDSPVFRMMRTVLALDKPLLAAVNGPAIGIGCTLLLHCDQVLVSRSAKLRMPFAPWVYARNSARACCCHVCSGIKGRRGCCWPTSCSAANRHWPGAWPMSCMTTANSAWRPR